MSASAWRRGGCRRPHGRAQGAIGLGLAWALGLGFAACKHEAPAAAEAPEDGAAQLSAPAEAPAGPAGSDGAMLAAGMPAPAEADAPDTRSEPAKDVPAEPVLPEQPYRVLIIGDSLVATGIGALLEKKLDAHPHVVCDRKGKSSSGLARPDFYDWPDEASRQLEQHEPDLVVVILGGNDGQDLTRRSNGEGRRVAWDHDDWAEAYRERVDDFLADLVADDRKVLWLGLPTMGLRSLEKKLVLIRDIQRNAVEALGDKGMYLDTAPFVTTEDGDLLTQARVGSRNKLQELRSKDKIHFTMAGSEYFADRVYPSVLEALGLPDVQPDP